MFTNPITSTKGWVIGGAAVAGEIGLIVWAMIKTLTPIV